ncbi:MAG: isoprenylcysteine carboxylmethyltransferase family protein [Ignavibacteriales bacterium]|nr:isoprenylcysteine carboxylmethyltransferase family protein [Ignavibacteriales bacterium]
MDLSFVLAPVSIVWIGSEILLARLKHSDQKGPSRDRRSIIILWLAISLSIPAAIVVRFLGVGYLPFNHAMMNLGGLMLIVMGLILRWVAVLTLRKYFTVDVAILSDHKIITAGVYKHLRHPSYTGILVSFVGLAITYSNWVSFVVIVVPITAAFLHRIRIEERALLEHFGESYRRYCASTWRLIPRMY